MLTLTQWPPTCKQTNRSIVGDSQGRVNDVLQRHGCCGRMEWGRLGTETGRRERRLRLEFGRPPCSRHHDRNRVCRQATTVKSSRHPHSN